MSSYNSKTPSFLNCWIWKRKHMDAWLPVLALISEDCVTLATACGTKSNNATVVPWQSCDANSFGWQCASSRNERIQKSRSSNRSSMKFCTMKTWKSFCLRSWPVYETIQDGAASNILFKLDVKRGQATFGPKLTSSSVKSVLFHSFQRQVANQVVHGCLTSLSEWKTKVWRSSVVQPLRWRIWL